MSTTNPSSHVSRTYGKRSGLKRKQTKEFVEPKELIPTGTKSQYIKRRRLSPDLEPEPHISSPTETDVDLGTDEEELNVRNPQRKVVYGSPRKLGATPSSQQSPSKTARDLSVIFDDIAPLASSSGSPSKIAKRMLARSKTDSSVESQPAPSRHHLFERTPSLPNLSSPSKNPEVTSSPSKNTGSIVPLIPPTSITPTARTYAGKFRSFLVSMPPSSNDPLSAAVEEDEFDTRESYTALRNRWGVDISEDDPYPTPSPSKSTKSNISTPDASPSRNGRKAKAMMNSARAAFDGTITLKSISELRNKGESRRFLDEVGYLFEGMDSKGAINLRRASALEITTKLCDSEFTRKAKVADFFSRTWSVFIEAGAGKGEDKILDTILVFFVALVARDAVSLAEMAQRASAAREPYSKVIQQTIGEELDTASLVDILFRILNNTSRNADPLVLVTPNRTSTDADFAKAGINKKDRLSLNSLYKIINSKSNLFSQNTPITTSLLITYALQNLSPSFIPITYFPSFLTSLQSTLAPGTSTSLKSALSLNWLDVTKSVAYENIYYHLRLLDTYLLDQWESASGLEGIESQNEENSNLKERNDELLNQARDTWLAEDLISLGVCIEIDESNNDFEFSQGCLDTTLRITVSLTHANELWGRKVVQSEYTMGWLMRLIFKNGREIQQNRAQIDVEHPVKLEKAEDQTLDEPDGIRADTLALDTLCLALGLLTNLVQIVEEAKQIVHDIRLGPSCTLKKKACAQKCTCPHPLSGIEILSQMYSQQQQIKKESTPESLLEDTAEARAEAEASFLRGHLAVLFGLLMMNCPENQSALMAALSLPASTTILRARNGKMTQQEKMGNLVEQAKDFAAFYTAVSNNLGAEKDSKVVKEVVAFLEVQRDTVFF